MDIELGATLGAKLVGIESFTGRSRLFKCNIKHIADYPHVTRYKYRILGIDNISSTVNMQHIKAGYYSIKTLNPCGILPLGPR